MTASLILAALLPLAAAQAPETKTVAVPAIRLQPAQAASPVAPVLGEDVALVLQADLGRIDIDRDARALIGAAADDAMLAGPRKMAGAWLAGLRKAGAKQFYLLVDPSDLPGLPLAAVPLPPGADAEALIRLLTTAGPESPLAWPQAETIRGVVVAGTPEALERVREAKPAARPELAAALASAGEAPLRLALIPSDTLRRSMEETVPELPQQVGGGPITAVSRGMQWAGLSLTVAPRPAVRMVAQATDADAAQKLQALMSRGLDELKSALQAQAQMAGPQGAGAEVKLLTQAVARLKPEVQGDRIEMTADLSDASRIVAAPLVAAREAARRSQCINNLKQIGLAMHNYHDANGSFPAAAITSNDGKPLLSWRVALLPYIEGQALYNEFHLDEPWDSAHNKTLIAKMPRLYACPDGGVKVIEEGKTSYFGPRGKQAMFPDDHGVKIAEITDGTSNTILVVEGSDEQAVLWTKPDDWEVGDAPSLKGLLGHHAGGVNVLFGDGSVRFVSQSINAAVLKALLTRNGGEVIGADGF